jgi:hypothetical protein
MKRLIFLALYSILGAPLTGFASQSCKVNLACTFYDVQSEVIGTVSGNPSTALALSFLVADLPALTETSVSCTPGNPAARVDFTVGPNSEHLEFIKTKTGLIGFASNLDSGAFTGEIICAK